MNKEFGRRLWKIRKERGLTQDQMAGKLQQRGFSISRGTYAKIEAGIRGISLKELYEIKSILALTWEELLGE